MKRYVAAAAAASGQPIPPHRSREETEGARASNRLRCGRRRPIPSATVVDGVDGLSRS